MHTAIPHRKWLDKYIYDYDAWYPQKLGEEFIIFKASSRVPFAALYIEPAETITPPSWFIEPGKGKVDALMHRLKVFALPRKAFVAYATFDDGAYISSHWEHPFNDSYWDTSLLGVFAEIPGQQVSGQFLILFFPEELGAVIFTLDAGLKIAFYGTPELWEELSNILGNR